MSTEPTDRIDVPTLLALAVLAATLDNLVHEALGHGGVALALGAKPIALSSAWWMGDNEGLSVWSVRAIKAGGTFANLILGGALVALWSRLAGFRRRNPRAGFFLWLTAVMNLLSGGGYMLADPIGGFGDWTGVLEGLGPRFPIAAGITLVGLVISFGALRFGARELGPYLGANPEDRKRRARLLCWLPYATNAALFSASAVFNPGGKVFVFTTALATLGGTCWLVWISFAALKRTAEPSTEAALGVARSPAWIVCGAVAAAFVLFVLGPAIRLSDRPLEFGASPIDPGSDSGSRSLV